MLAPVHAECRMPNAECRWKLRGINEYIFQLGGGPHTAASGNHPHRIYGYDTLTCIHIYRVRESRLALNDCPRLSCDIYFIGVSLPSSMMIYNCCPVGYNYYNYRFFVRLSQRPLDADPAGPRFSRSIPLCTGSTPSSFVRFLLPSVLLHAPLGPFLTFRLSSHLPESRQDTP